MSQWTTEDIRLAFAAGFVRGVGIDRPDIRAKAYTAATDVYPHGTPGLARAHEIRARVKAYADSFVAPGAPAEVRQAAWSVGLRRVASEENLSVDGIRAILRRFGK